MTELLAASATDIGRLRSQNQDCALVADGLVAVADGMGGHAGGDIAARTAVQVLAEAFARERTTNGLVQAAKDANRAILQHSERDRSLRGMGTTLSAAAIVAGRHGEQLAIVHVGDSRVYLRTRAGFAQLTADHSLVEEMVRHGELTADEASIHPQRHILTRALGIDPSVEVDTATFDPVPGSRLLLCSDGLTNECTDAEIAAILDEHEDRAEAAGALVARALAHGGSDNITVVVADLLPASDPRGASDGIAAVAPGVPSRRRSAAAPSPPPPLQATSTRQPGRRERGRRRVERVVTVWSVLFVLVFVAVIGGAVGFTEWYNNATYFISVARGHVAIFEGRPGGFLWYRPKLIEVMSTTPRQVFAPYRSLLAAGIIETSYGQAQHVASDLTNVNRFLALPGANATASAARGSTTTSLAATSPPASTTPVSSTTGSSLAPSGPPGVTSSAGSAHSTGGKP